MIYHEWEIIDESLFEETGVGKMIQVSRDNEYINEMAEQNRKVVKILQEKYPLRMFRVGKWNSHDFGQYQEVEERLEFDDDESDNEDLI